MKPLDPRLLRHARQAAVYIAVLVALGTAAAGLIIAQAQLLSGAIAGAVDHGATLRSLRGIVIALAAVLAGRALIAWATEAASYRASAAVKSQLRRQLLARAAALGPRWLAGRRSAELTALATEGIDALDGYFSRYLPQLILAVIVPVAVLIWVGAADLLSGVIILVTLPLIPLFGALVGMATHRYAQRRWEALARLSHHFLDVVTGLPTLKVFGRSREQRASIGKVTGEYRSATMRTLRIAFLSSLVLELAATMSVALIAVSIGLRLVNGHLDLRTGLLVLILAPEAYLPLRAVGAQFHASADGLAAADEAFAVIEEPAPPAGEQPAPEPRAIRALRAEGIAVSQPGRPRPAPDGVSSAGQPGGDHRGRGPQRVREIHPAERPAGVRPAVGGPGHRHRAGRGNGPARDRPGRLARAPRVGSAGPGPVPRDGRVEYPARLARRARRGRRGGRARRRPGRRAAQPGRG